MTTPNVTAARRAGVMLAALSLLAAFVITNTPARAAITAPTFVNFQDPEKHRAGEPSIGVNWATGTVMFQALSRTLRVTNFNEQARTATWTDVTPMLNHTFDPILFTDHTTNRTFVSHLLLACSELSFTDDDGETWTGNPVGCAPGSMLDHQTVGGGPFPAAFAGALPGYPNAVWYCSDILVEAGCGASMNGGLAFNPATPAYQPRQCSGLVGHIKVGPDGTAYVPISICGGMQGLAVSSNLGATWSIRKVPGSLYSGEGDPAVAVGPAGTVYFGYQQPEPWAAYGSKAFVRVSRDQGSTWTKAIDVGKSFGIKNVQFSTMVAGDDDRAALAFLGTTTAGDDQAEDFSGRWHLYVATTYDGGETWTTVDTTPSTGAVQIGRICMGGIGCSGGRNLLDFIGIDIDAKGRIYVAYADGCLGCKKASTSTEAAATISRQSGGTDLIASL